MNESVSLILLAGGHGTRMGTSLPKQFLTLQEKPIARYSLEIFRAETEIAEIIIVCDPAYTYFFDNLAFPIKFALPGLRRQDSVFNGLALVNDTIPWVCIHDSARPFIDAAMIKRLFEEGKKVGAATVGIPIKPTIKECDSDHRVIRTFDRSKIWEIQTPQFLSKAVLIKGFEMARKHQITVTDDTSLAELVNHPVKIVEGSYTNIKITTPEDLIFARSFAETL